MSRAPHTATPRRAPWVPFVVGVASCVALPAASWVRPQLGPLWAMYTSRATFRLRIELVRATGERVAVPPALLAPRLTPAAGADVLGAVGPTWRHAPLLTLPDHLDELARIACTVSRVPARAEVVLEVQPRAGTAAWSRAGSAECP